MNIIVHLVGRLLQRGLERVCLLNMGLVVCVESGDRVVQFFEEVVHLSHISAQRLIGVLNDAKHVCARQLLFLALHGREPVGDVGHHPGHLSLQFLELGLRQVIHLELLHPQRADTLSHGFGHSTKNI